MAIKIAHGTPDGKFDLDIDEWYLQDDIDFEFDGIELSRLQLKEARHSDPRDAIDICHRLLEQYAYLKHKTPEIREILDAAYNNVCGLCNCIDEYTWETASALAEGYEELAQRHWRV